jgi:hypothetical protein
MPNFSLASASPSTKVLLTLFLAAVLGGLAVALLQYCDRAGLGARGAIEWVRGNEDDPEPAEIKAPKTYRELLSITHDHAFALPLLLFVLLHLVALTAISEGAKIALYTIAFFSLFATLSAPWLIAYVGPSWAALLRAAGACLAGSIGFSALLSLWEIWCGKPRQKATPRA